MSLYKAYFILGENFYFQNNSNSVLYVYYSGRLVNGYYTGAAQLLYSGNNLSISGGSGGPDTSLTIVSNGVICCYIDTRTISDGSYGNRYYYYLNKSGNFVKDIFEYNKPYNITFSDTPSSGLSQLTVQGNNLSSVSYNNENYTTFPTTLSLDSSATTLNVNGRVGSQRIN